MFLEIVFRDLKSSIVVDINRYVDAIRSVVPFSSKINIWKHEIYFSTPIELRYSREDLVYKVYRGGVYYWPPGKAICIFYGFSHSYTPVIHIGNLVDPINVLSSIEKVFDVDVKEHTPDTMFDRYVEVLMKRGYRWATPLRSGEKVLVAYKMDRERRYSISISIEPYGIYIESEGIARFRNDLSTIQELSRLKSSISIYNYARIDISEDSYIVISANSLPDPNDFEKALKDVEEALESIEHFSKVV
uniref:Cyclophilin TM1367-like domain-containing protein n=1 Tax=Ignisphaera aggregans TaxID=334771 RepID=A0A7J3QF70_9CREN